MKIKQCPHQENQTYCLSSRRFHCPETKTNDEWIMHLSFFKFELAMPQRPVVARLSLRKLLAAAQKSDRPLSYSKTLIAACLASLPL
jgi:hypothetical protein